MSNSNCELLQSNNPVIAPSAEHMLARLLAAFASNLHLVRHFGEGCKYVCECGCRAASVVTTMTSEFLTIDGKQYQQLLGQLQREELKAKVDVLRRAPMFRSPNCMPAHRNCMLPACLMCDMYLHTEGLVYMTYGCMLDVASAHKLNAMLEPTVSEPASGQAGG